jgi:hypothetical protein
MEMPKNMMMIWVSYIVHNILVDVSMWHWIRLLVRHRASMRSRALVVQGDSRCVGKHATWLHMEKLMLKSWCRVPYNILTGDNRHLPQVGSPPEKPAGYQKWVYDLLLVVVLFSWLYARSIVTIVAGGMAHVEAKFSQRKETAHVQTKELEWIHVLIRNTKRLDAHECRTMHERACERSS